MLSDQSTYSLSWRFSSEKYKEIKDKVLKDLEMRHDYTPGTSRGSSQSGSGTSEDEKKELSSSSKSDQDADKNVAVPIEEQDSDDDPAWEPEEMKKSDLKEAAVPRSIQTRLQSNKDEIDNVHLQTFNKK